MWGRGDGEGGYLLMWLRTPFPGRCTTPRCWCTASCRAVLCTTTCLLIHTPLITHAPPQVVYDPAVLVRGELAVLFARFVRGHGPAVRAAMAQQQRKLEEAVAQVGRGRAG